MRDNREAIRRIERAEIERWFTGDALGRVFHAGDGRTWPIDDAAAERAQARAWAVVETMLDRQRRQVIGIVLIAMVAFGLIPYLLPGLSIAVLMPSAGIGLFVALPAWSALEHWLYRRRLRLLRAGIAATMTGPPLVDAHPLRHARTNLFRVAQHLWILLVLLAVLTAQLTLGPDALLRLQSVGPTPTLLAIAVVMGVAWALYFAAEQVDRVQRRRPERLHPIAYRARDSWSQAD